MPPNIGSETAAIKAEDTKTKDNLEIYYDGYFYNVTDFAKRHPGGNVIKFYTEKGEDATQAVDQFHFRSRSKVNGIMKSLKRRPAQPFELHSEEKVLSRNESLSKDFKKLFEELKEEGYFDPDLGHVIIRIWECTMLIVFSYGIFFQCETYLKKFLATVLIGFAYSRCGWVYHEGGHGSLTGSLKIDKFIQVLAGCFVLGGSGVWWNSQHNRHHAMPQRLHHDVDLATLPIAAFHKRTVKHKEEINRFFIKYQAFLYFTVDVLFGVLAWRFVLHPRYQIKKKAYHELIVGLPSLFFLSLYVGPIWFISVMYWFSLFLGLNFSLSHTHLEVADKPTHWIEYSLAHTANISSNMWVDCWMGYLNYQIEHHLFPAMPQFKQKLITHRVKALAEKYDLPYRVFSYPEACKMALKNLNEVGQELTN